MQVFFDSVTFTRHGGRARILGTTFDCFILVCMVLQVSWDYLYNHEK